MFRFTDGLFDLCVGLSYFSGPRSHDKWIAFAQNSPNMRAVFIVRVQHDCFATGCAFARTNCIICMRSCLSCKSSRLRMVTLVLCFIVKGVMCFVCWGGARGANALIVHILLIYDDE